MRTLLLTATVLFLTSLAVAQQQEPSLKPSIAPRADVPTPLSLEVQYNADLPPAYITVRGTETKPRWIWVTRFRYIPGVVPAPDALPVQAVRIESQFNGETADVKVSLFRGRENFEREDPVATYHIGLDEKTTVTELKSFGIEPINVTLLNAVPPLPPAPAFENRTNSIEIVSVESENVPLPAYKLTLRNSSDKKVRAVKIEVIREGRTRQTGFWQNPLDAPVLDAGGLGQKTVSAVVAQKTPTTYAPGTATSNTILLRTVVFDDLTFEGDEEPACTYEKFVVGRRLWVKRVLAFIDQELAKPALSAGQFKQSFSSLTYQLDDSEKTGKSAVSAKCPNPDSSVHISTQTLTLELLRDLDRIINTRPAPPIDFRVWLQSKRDDYKTWLARLN